LAPENTILGFRAAIDHHACTLELDTAMTSDGVVVVQHDERLHPDIARLDGKWIVRPIVAPMQGGPGPSGAKADLRGSLTDPPGARRRIRGPLLRAGPLIVVSVLAAIQWAELGATPARSRTLGSPTCDVGLARSGRLVAPVGQRRGGRAAVSGWHSGCNIRQPCVSTFP